jgi:hypothetical protein
MPATNLERINKNFVKTSTLAEQTIINMEDYTFMLKKKPKDFIVRIIFDFPHETEIDFFEEIKGINFVEAINMVDKSI